MYEVLAFTALIFYGMTTGLIVMLIKDRQYLARQHSLILAYQNKIVDELCEIELERLENALQSQLNLLQDYKDAIRFLENLQCENQKLNKMSGHYENTNPLSKFDLSYLIPWLSEHLVKYPDAIIPKLSGEIVYTCSTARYIMRFDDANEPKIARYVKPCLKLLKEKRSRKVNVIKEANKVVRSKRQRKVAGVLS